jgi:hypothetical protein
VARFGEGAANLQCEFFEYRAGNHSAEMPNPGKLAPWLTSVFFLALLQKLMPRQQNVDPGGTMTPSVDGTPAGFLFFILGPQFLLELRSINASHLMANSFLHVFFNVEVAYHVVNSATSLWPPAGMTPGG